MPGRLIGIARKDRPHAVMEVIDHVRIGRGTGVTGDYRGALKPGHNKRQVTILMAEDWSQAIAAHGTPIEWQQRRANLLVEGIVLPREEGARVRIGTALFEITGECDPCRRMDAVSDGLQLALRPEWRGGRTCIVLEDGAIAIGDEVRIER
jgi:MOSC domain-containing protein YiiM